MFGLVLLGLIILVCLLLAGAAFHDGADAMEVGSVLSIVGIAMLIWFSFLSRDILKDGSPRINIPAGEYRIEFVHVSGPNVSVGVVKEGYLYFYQFPLADVRGKVDREASLLSAAQIGDKKVYELSRIVPSQ